MIAFSDCGNVQQTLLMLLMFAALFLQLFLTIEDIACRGYVLFFIDGLLLIAELFYAGLLFSAKGGAGGLTAPVWFLRTLETALLVYASVSYICTMKRMKHSLSRESIKEGCDNLPDGICFFDGQGTVRLINRKMLSIGIMLFGNEIQTLEEFHAALKEPSPAVECLDRAVSLYRFPDGTVRSFTEHAVTDRDGKPVTEVIAADVTALYEKQAQLNRENNRLADANRRMKWLLDNMSDIVREEEILSMKIRIHDDIGHSILSARKALLEQQDIAVIHENAAQWERAVDLLYRANNMPPVPDEWETVRSRAGELGIEIELSGELPESKFLRHLLILAVRECVTNCVRHAGGSKVIVKAVSLKNRAICVITNDGKAPEQEITEGSGLSSLRRRIEREGGIMKLESSPRFSLTAILKAKEE